MYIGINILKLRPGDELWRYIHNFILHILHTASQESGQLYCTTSSSNCLYSLISWDYKINVGQIIIILKNLSESRNASYSNMVHVNHLLFSVPVCAWHTFRTKIITMSLKGNDIKSSLWMIYYIAK